MLLKIPLCGQFEKLFPFCLGITGMPIDEEIQTQTFD